MARTNRLYEDFLRRTGQQLPPGPNILPTTQTGFGTPGEALPGGGGWLPNDGSFSGWTPPNGRPYGPGSAPGYGTSTDPERAGFNLFGDARSWLAANSQIFDPYGGKMTAGLSPLQTQARNQLNSFFQASPHWGPMQNATSIANQVGMYQPQNVTGGSFLSGDLGAYMNPYQQQVIDASLGDIERSRLMANNAGARSAGAGTYGGDRNALIEAETNRAYADQAARTSAQLRSQGFDTAAGLMGQDLNRGLTANLANQGAGLTGSGLNLQAAGQLGSLGNSMFNMGLGAASAVNQFGTQDQMTQQDDLDRQYNEYMRSMYGPMEGYNFLGGLLSGNSYATPGGPGRGRGALGGAATGASIGSAFGPPGALIGGGIGALGGWLFG